MGFYAILADTITCPSCGHEYSDCWQFHYGSCADLPEYQVGDRVRWEPVTCPRSFGQPET